jgi:hypothetical protein
MNMRKCEVSFDLTSKKSEEDNITKSVCLEIDKKPK